MNLANYTEDDIMELQQAMTPQELAFFDALLNPDFIPLSKYCEGAWHVVEPATPYQSNWHIDAISDHLEAVTWGQIRNLIINIPPRHMKSLEVSVFWPTWTWTFSPAKRWLFSSYAEALSIRDSLKCRRLIQSAWYQYAWRTAFQLTGDQNQKTRFENDKTGYRIATSVGGVGTGEGGDFIVVDDPHKVKEAESETIRKGVLEWWDSTMPTRLNDPATGSKVIIQQRVHENDLTGHLLEKMKEGGEHWELLKIPAEYEPTKYVTVLGWQDPRTEHGQLLWPERFDEESIKNLKTSLGSRRAAGQLQQNPAPAEGDIFKNHWWRFWLPPGKSAPPVQVKLENGQMFTCPQITLPQRLSNHLQSWDMNLSESDSANFAVGQVWATANADKFLLDQKRGRWGLPKILSELEELTKEWPQAILKLIENKANGPATMQMLRGKISGMVAINPRLDKVARAEMVSPEVEAGNVYLPHPSIFPWVEDFLHEYTTFPNATNDDQVDTGTQALQRLIIILRGKLKNQGKGRSHSSRP